MFARIHISKNRVTQASLIQESLSWTTRLGNAVLATTLPIIALIAINLLCYYKSLFGYFAADDFLHVAYLSDVFSGHPELLLKNFVGNWMQAEGTNFYRPLISLTLAWDYLLGGANGFFFHLSNVLFQIGSTIFLFLTVRRIAQPVAPEAARTLAFFSAALFAASPLHCEVVSWIIGRVDSVCTAFYLAAFWLFLKGRQDRSNISSILSVCAFIASLLSKEMAVTLPAAAALLVVIEPRGKDVRVSFKDRASEALRATIPLWLTLFAYIGVRTCALGTLTGGYSGSVGEGLTHSMWHRFFEDGSLLRVFFPFNAEVISSKDVLRKWLVTLYALVAGSALIRYLWFRYDSGLTRVIGFGLAWFLLAMAPTYQVFNIAPSLQCSRFAYLGTAPLCLLLAALLVPMCTTRRPFAKLASVFGVCLLGAFVICSIVITQKNNLPWVKASEQVRTFRTAIEQELSKLPAGKSLAILNVPERMDGAHMIYNGSMLAVLLSQPLSNERLIDRVISFEPPMWGEPDMINATRLRSIMAQSGQQCAFYKWDMQQRILIPVHFTTTVPATTAETLKGEGNNRSWSDFSTSQFSSVKQPSFTVMSPEIKKPATAVDFVDVEFSTSSKAPVAAFVVVLSWKGTEQANFPAEQKLVLQVVPDGRTHKYRFNVSEHKSWVMSGIVDHIAFDFPFTVGQPDTVQISRIAMLDGQTELPQLHIKDTNWVQNNDGTAHSNAKSINLNYDASGIPDAVGVTIEISQPNAWFEHYSGTLRDTTTSKHAMQTITKASTVGEITVPLEALPTSGFFEIRLFPIAADGTTRGYASDPINLQVGQPATSGGKNLGQRVSGSTNLKARPRREDPLERCT